MASSPSTRTKVFISYSHADEEWLERLKRHLKPLVRDGHWIAGMTLTSAPVLTGSRKSAPLSTEHKSRCSLISADFFASDFIDEDELPPLLVAAQAEGFGILPVILSASRLARHQSLARFQAANSPDRPLNKMSYARAGRGP